MRENWQIRDWLLHGKLSNKNETLLIEMTCGSCYRGTSWETNVILEREFELRKVKFTWRKERQIWECFKQSLNLANIQNSTTSSISFSDFYRSFAVSKSNLSASFTSKPTNCTLTASQNFQSITHVALSQWLSTHILHVSLHKKPVHFKAL
jgi:hypothetical protein